MPVQPIKQLSTARAGGGLRIARYFSGAVTGLLVGWLVAVFSAPALAAGTASIQGLRFGDHPDGTRIVLDISQPVDHRVFSLTGPDRVVVDISDVRMAPAILAGHGSHGAVRSVRAAPREGDGLRVVFDLSQSAEPRSFLVPPGDGQGHRLVIDLRADSRGNTAVKAVPAALDQSRNIIVAIAAGHGGGDPGAIGSKGTREKDVTLKIARALKDLVNKEPGMRAVMVREGDQRVTHRERMRRARDAKADLFVAIHADAFRDHRARGASVYVLSERGASSEAARWLAEKHNAEDLVGGVTLDDKDDLIASVLLDLSQTATLSASVKAADSVLNELTDVARLHKNSVQQAGFLVLKSPDIPSILVETAFISNPEEERQLNDRQHQQRVAAAILRGVRNYFLASPPPGTRFAALNRPLPEPMRHTISRGETLGSIAQRYKVSLDALRHSNGLKNDRIRSGQELRIPVHAGG